MDPKTKRASKEAAKKKKKKSPAKKFIFTVAKILIIFFVAASCAVAGILGGAIYGYIKAAQPIRDEDLQIKILTSFIYDSEGNEIAQLTGKDNKNRELVLISDVPQYLKDAFVAVEDERFYEHPGIDLRRIASAAIGYVTKGEVVHGGSTITQQVVKNITGKTSVSLQRKVQEQWNAIQLEKRYDKDKILEIYMNVIYMGNSYYGVQSASKAYFGKDVKDLSLAECALLAGITNSPANYDPFTEKGRKNAKKRQEIILDLMLEQNMIDEKEYNEALKQELVFADRDDSDKNITVQSYFVDQVIRDVTEDLMAERGMSRDMALTTIYNYGLKIYTTQDPAAQKAMDEVFTDDKYFPVTNSNGATINTVAKETGEHPQSAMVVIDPYTGEVKALYGGYGEKKGSNTLNRATQINRQPGSSFKPIAVYAPAIDVGAVTPATVIDDVPVYMDNQNKNKPYPQNYDFTYDGLTTIRNAIKASINVVAARVWRDHLGPDRSIEYLKKVGIDRENEKYVSLAMGGLEKGVSPLQMAAAYVPFVNKGLYYEPVTYTKVLDSDGKTLLEKKPKYNAAYSETTAFLMADMMQEVAKPKNSPYPRSGTAYPRVLIQKGKMPVAGKTGTTSDNIDKWFVGYTPYYVAATWYGYDNKVKPIKLTSAEYSQAQIIWQAVMEKIHENKEPKPFTPPPGIVKKQICIYSGKIASELCSQDPRGNATRMEYFAKGTEPSGFDVCDIHVKATVCTESKDIWNRNLLAGSYCPLGSTVEKVFIQRSEPYVPPLPGAKYPKDFAYELPAGEYCTIHGEISHTSHPAENTRWWNSEDDEGKIPESNGLPFSEDEPPTIFDLLD
jgi:penicillin-binding protein 1A